MWFWGDKGNRWYQENKGLAQLRSNLEVSERLEVWVLSGDL